MDGLQGLVRQEGCRRVQDTSGRELRGRDGPAGRRPQPDHSASAAPLQYARVHRDGGSVAVAHLRDDPRLVALAHERRGSLRRDAVLAARADLPSRVQHGAEGDAADADTVALHVQPARSREGLPGPTHVRAVQTRGMNYFTSRGRSTYT